MDSQNHITSSSELQQVVSDVVSTTPVTDIHTHLFDTRFGDLLLWGIDELITYHYLIAEVMRVEHGSTTPDAFYEMSKKQQADLIWRRLYLDNSPISEACRGPITVLGALGLDVANRDLDEMRTYFEQISAEEYIDEVFEAAKVQQVVMTNDPFNATEQEVWNSGEAGDERFRAALRLDELIVNWGETRKVLADDGYDVSEDFSGNTADEVMRFLEEWHEKMDPVYMAVSLPWDFKYPADDMSATVIEKAILPYANRSGLPFSPMIGVKRQMRPSLRDAGDGVGKCDITAIEHMCAENPEVKFLVTLLSRENQHELCVAARKFGNLMPFGCWWFLNDPSLIDEITRMRIELLGLSFIPQHSDARILDQLIYKWSHFRNILSRILVEKYNDAIRSGWVPTRSEIERDVEGLFSRNFEEFIAG